MKYGFDSCLFILTVIVIVGSPRRWIQGEETSKIFSIIPGEPLLSHRASISFNGRLDPAIIHSHGVKMKWSKPRHRKYHNPSHEMPPPPSLTHSVSRKLSDQVFTSLFSKLPLEHAKDVYELKSTNKLVDLEPKCSTVPYKDNEQPLESGKQSSSDKYKLSDGMDSNVDVLLEESRILEQHLDDMIETCQVNFTTLYRLYGISFNFKLSFRTTPMNLSQQDMVSRITPDHRGWTQSVLNTDAFISLELCSPDFVPYNRPKNGRVRMAGNGNVTRDSIEIDQRNIEETVELLLKSSTFVLGLVHVENISRSNVNDFEIVPITSHRKQNGEMLEKEDERSENSETSLQTTTTHSSPVMADYDLPPEILNLCNEYKLSNEECVTEVKALELDLNKDMQINDRQSNTRESLSKKNHDDDHEMNELDIARLVDASTKSSDIHAIDREWDMPMEEVIQVRQDMISLERLIDETLIGAVEH